MIECLFWSFGGDGFPLEVIGFLCINTMQKFSPAIKGKATSNVSRGDGSYEILRVNKKKSAELPVLLSLRDIFSG